MVVKYSSFLSNVSESKKPIEIDDNTPPAPPKIISLPENTNTNELEVSGTSESGALITIKVNNKKTEVLANNNGQFSHTFTLIEGINKISAHATDSTGNKSRQSDEKIVIYDNTPPLIEITSPKNGSEFFGSKQRQITIEGTAIDADTVFVNDRQVVLENDQSFSFSTSLSEGENTFLVKSVDKAGNETELDLKVTFSE